MNRFTFRRMLRRELATMGVERVSTSIDDFFDIAGLRKDALPALQGFTHTQAASGTAREAPSASLSGDAPSHRDERPARRRTTGGAANERAEAATLKPEAAAEEVSPRGLRPDTPDEAPYARIARAHAAVKARPAPVVDRSRLPIAESREGCPRCGVRGDLGCDHQRAMGEA